MEKHSLLIQSVFCKFGLDIKDLAAQCYDEASTMCGGYKGVASRVKNENPKGIYVHAVAMS